ncbi:YraN family protein [Candidatus Saccharibacteria bacterium]|nr:YraN family protein [Candidatus Saccharibacteria bacterium]
MNNDGYKIIRRNWKTKVCEIDVVAQKDGIVYFIEVKYRSSAAQGNGFEYVAYQKLRRMTFAAEIWRQTNSWDGDYRLMAAAVSGLDCQNIELVEL